MLPETLEKLLSRGVQDVIKRDELERLLLGKKKLRIKHGVDPTKPDLHLGHAVIYRKLRQFQELGHTVVFLIGDFTARFGDPTDKIKSRSLQSKADVELAAQTYLEQIGKILDKKQLEIRRNSEWYENMRAEELLKLMSHFTVSRMLERDMFQKRLKAQDEIGLHEPVYPVLQAYDSVMLKSDLTVIGTDQTFNELQARSLQEFFGQNPQQIITMKILVGLDGKDKMSKTLGNYIRVTESPKEMFGKIMSLPDSAMPSYAELLTNLDEQEFIDPKNPKALKIKLAKDIVSKFHSYAEAEKVAEEFDKVHKQKEIPEDIPEIQISTKTNQSVAKVLAEAFGQSVSAIRRDIEQGGVSYEGKVIKDPNERAKLGLYKKGKRHFVKLKKKS
ncbi:tyrosine--tRNA ligase [Candidatus Parcubacteria bacterium]|jgi:tyrosyl-tRNA synthetase|nr:MAG: tyrosine--tRNA ligase [Candidatus Parcubacteria bacterium]